ncbi:WhiB family transcriptional regulator [Arthrobacter castelli]|uniref:WhiB family transcriptional regulator n=1 Tax=Arthrobacter castelli TaxID=271431 RepID=UPI00040899B5|nr:WhiB family transcriptional regulator [Arthrobacter castelli]
MGHAERNQDRSTIEAQAAARYGSRGVPSDWYVDPADPEAARKFKEDSEQSLDDAATAFLAAHEASETGESTRQRDDRDDAAAPTDLLNAPPEKQFESTRQRDDAAVWIGLPGLAPEDEGELGWQADALCAQTDPEAFFPEKGGSTRDAKKVCGACNVQSECLEYALANDERFGIWGGMSERERRRLRKRAV